MADPITGAATIAAADAAKDATTAVVQETGGFFSSLFSSLVKTPWAMIKGVVSGTFGNIVGVLFTSGGLLAALKFMPDVVNLIPGTKIKEMLRKDIHEGGDGALIKDVLLAGVGINAVTGAVSSGFSQAVAGEPNKIGGVTGSVLALAVVSAGVMAMTHKKDVGYAGTADAADPKNPTTTPPKPVDVAVVKL